MEQHYQVLDKKQTSLDHQDWKQVTLRSTQSINQEKKQSTKKISQEKQKDIKLHKQVEEDNLNQKHEHTSTTDRN